MLARERGGANHEAERGRFDLEVRQFLQEAVYNFAAKAQSRSRNVAGATRLQSAAAIEAEVGGFCGDVAIA